MGWRRSAKDDLAWDQVNADQTKYGKVVSALEDTGHTKAAEKVTEAKGRGDTAADNKAQVAKGRKERGQSRG
jgi:hypothetical protein